jgi:uncharacterized protein (TIGR02145 family)
MNIFKQLCRTLVLWVALSVSVVLVGCDGDNGTGGGNGNGSSSSAVYGEPLVYGGQTYKTVVIGGQTWMAENLNYQTGNSWCYNDSNSYCNKYGRLYDWETAMSACPSGWHLPASDKWTALAKAAGGTGTLGTSGGTAGKALKSKNGWNDYEGKSGNGTDKYGFSALPGGFRYNDDDFHAVGGFGYWWTATVISAINDYVSGRRMNYNYDHVNDYGSPSFAGYSVRCVKDD